MPQFPVTHDLKKIEKAGAAWASQCTKGLFTERDFEFFATRYQPLYESLKEVEGRYQTTLLVGMTEWSGRGAEPQRSSCGTQPLSLRHKKRGGNSLPIIPPKTR